MNRSRMWIFILALIIPVSLFSQQQEGFEINGHIEGLKNGDKVLLAHWNYLMVGNRANRDDSCLVTNNGDFHLKGVMPDDHLPHGYFFAFVDNNDNDIHRKFDPVLNTKTGGTECNLLIKNGERITVTGPDINKIPSYSME